MEITSESKLHAQPTAVVTGGASGLGASFVRTLSQRGFTVVVADIADEPAQLLATEVGGLAIHCDVTNAEDVETAAATTVATYGRLDVMINNAGIAPLPNEERFNTAIANQMLRMEGRLGDMTPLNVLADMDPQEWDTMLRVHLYGTFYGCRAAARYMTPRRTGSIINISSVLGLHPSAMAPHYSTAKAGIIALTKSSAAELAPFGIRVNAVCPGYIDTPLLAPMTDLMKTVIVSQIGMGRLGDAQEIAEMVAYLASPASSYSTGEIMSVSGGYGS